MKLGLIIRNFVRFLSPLAKCWWVLQHTFTGVNWIGVSLYLTATVLFIHWTWSTALNCFETSMTTALNNLRHSNPGEIHRLQTEKTKQKTIDCVFHILVYNFEEPVTVDTIALLIDQGRVLASSPRVYWFGLILPKRFNSKALLLQSVMMTST